MSPNYISINGLNIHYLDEGPSSAPIFLLLHGLPAWSFMYRKMIPVLVESGYRVICPDMVGLGLSDQFQNNKDYTYQNQLAVYSEFIRALGIRNSVVYGQDWGASFALHLTLLHQDLFEGCALSNGLVPTGTLERPPRLRAWMTFAKHSPYIPVGQIVSWGCRKPLPLSTKRKYAKPFRGGRSKAPVRILPHWIPTHSKDPNCPFFQSVWKELGTLQKPVLCLFSKRDKFTRGADDYLMAHIPGCEGQNHQQLEGGHFIQEDASEELTNLLLEFRTKVN